MTPWLVFGGAGTGTGALIVQQALSQQRPVVALVRDRAAAQRLSDMGVKVVQGDARDATAVQNACQQAGSQALIISTMGGGEEYLAHRTVIDTAEQCGLSRMILVTSLGCGDGWQHLSPRSKAAFGQAVRQKTLAEVWLQTSGLENLIIRPGGLMNGSATGMAQLTRQTGVHGFVCRADVAQVVCRLAAQEKPDGQIYTLIQPGLQPARTAYKPST